MKNFRFYAEFAYKKDKRKATRKNLIGHIGTCLAVPLENGRPLYCGNSNNFECYGAVYYKPNSSCAGTSTDWEYLQNWCKRISESQAREIHPKLFNYLEQ